MQLRFLAGVSTAFAVKLLVMRALTLKLQRDIEALNNGDYRPLLASFHRDAVLRFADGNSRWSGTHRGRPAIEKFFQDFVAAGIKGQITEIYSGGAPWRMTLLARFDDYARTADRTELHSNRTVLLIRTSWGKIISQEDFFEDTTRIDAFEKKLRQL
ncbi:nuclear transport factor 2 family protein [Rhodococcus sp. 06-235-1A]|uniref:nuclear transport factor 2 family protein n=1 Tax=Rhodococcus sp. 06-235-1A TaxID=2022508 RepID=UPI00117A3B65|nr:nuclear transport factor 2 family protein [Rhodococcus sp. 06-235-1A]